MKPDIRLSPNRTSARESMPLTVIATPIGNPEDITLRAKSVLEKADIVVGEEAKPTRRLLKSVGVPPQKTIELLNEHSDTARISELAEICRSQDVALVSDCGTPGFCDPGAHLVKACRESNISITSCPGPSSLMTFLSICGERLDQFWFEGFLPANTDQRLKRLKTLKTLDNTLILMDTPYRLKKTLENCATHFADQKLVLGISLTQPGEAVYTGKAAQILREMQVEKAEFILAVLKKGL